MTAHSNGLPERPSRLLGIPRDRLLQNWKAAHDRACAYLEALGVAGSERDTLATRAVELAFTGACVPGDGGGGVGEVLDAVEQLLLDARVAETDASETDPFLTYRLDAALSGERLPRPLDARAPWRLANGRLASAPVMTRGTVVAHRLEGRGLRRWNESSSAGPLAVDAPDTAAKPAQEKTVPTASPPRICDNHVLAASNSPLVIPA